MRTAVFAAAFAAGALAVPHEKRAVVTDTDVNVVYVTDVVTVTGGDAQPTTTQVTTTEKAAKHWGGHKSHHSWNWGWSSQQTSEAETTEAPAPTSTEEAPAPTSTEQAPPPSSYEQPTTWASPAPSPSTKTKQPKPQPTSTDSGSTSVPTSYSEISTYHHNIHRTNHSAPDVKWSQSLADTAQKIAASCSYAHNTDMDGGGYGQNIAAGVEGNNVSAVITDLFYNGEVGYYAGLYNEAQPDMTNFEKWGHFSQIVWKSTTEVGCYTQDCTSQGLANVDSSVSPYFTVCNYGPPGNYANEYGDNVLEPKNEASAQWNTGLQ